MATASTTSTPTTRPTPWRRTSTIEFTTVGAGDPCDDPFRRSHDPGQPAPPRRTPGAAGRPRASSPRVRRTCGIRAPRRRRRRRRLDLRRDLRLPTAPAYATDTPAVGDALRMTGRVVEFQNQTEIDNLTSIIECGTADIPSPTEVTLPETVNGELERYEGMLVTIPQQLTAQQNFFQGRFGQVTLASGGRLDTPTDEFPAASPERIALTRREPASADRPRRRQQQPESEPDPVHRRGRHRFAPATRRQGITGLLDEGAINSNTAIRDYRIQPTAPVTFTRAQRPTRRSLRMSAGGCKWPASTSSTTSTVDGLGGRLPDRARGANTPARVRAAAHEDHRSHRRARRRRRRTDGDRERRLRPDERHRRPGRWAERRHGAGHLRLDRRPGTGVAKPDEPIKTALIYRPARVEPVGDVTQRHRPVSSSATPSRRRSAWSTTASS